MSIFKISAPQSSGPNMTNYEITSEIKTPSTQKYHFWKAQSKSFPKIPGFFKTQIATLSPHGTFEELTFVSIVVRRVRRTRQVLARIETKERTFRYDVPRLPCPPRSQHLASRPREHAVVRPERVNFWQGGAAEGPCAAPCMHRPVRLADRPLRQQQRSARSRSV